MGELVILFCCAPRRRENVEEFLRFALSKEGQASVAAFGALQGWSAIYSFAYCHNASFEPRRIESFFDIKSDTAKMAHMPACAALFLRGDVDAAKQLLTVPLSRDGERRKLRQTRSAWTLTAGQLGLDPQRSLLHRIAIDLSGAERGFIMLAPRDKALEFKMARARGASHPAERTRPWNSQSAAPQARTPADRGMAR